MSTRARNKDLLRLVHETPIKTLESPRSYDEKQRDVAQYLSEMILELYKLAKSVGLPDDTGELQGAYYNFWRIAHMVTPTHQEAEYVRNLEKANDDSGISLRVPESFKDKPDTE